MPERNSFWRRSFDAARVVDDWFRVERLYARTTAAQIASDIRRAHLDGRQSVRTQGIRRGERWEAKWVDISTGAPGDCEVWIRLVR